VNARVGDEHDCGANARVHDRGDECGQGVFVYAIMCARTLALRRAARRRHKEAETDCCHNPTGYKTQDRK